MDLRQKCGNKGTLLPFDGRADLNNDRDQFVSARGTLHTDDTRSVDFSPTPGSKQLPPLLILFLRPVFLRILTVL